MNEVIHPPDGRPVEVAGIDLSSVLALLLRQAMTLLGGVLVALGLTDQSGASQMTASLSGILMTLASIGWSYWQKRQAARKQAAALALPAGSSPDDVTAALAPAG